MPLNLVTGGVRSGKSRYAEFLLASEPDVTYVAPDSPRDGAPDPEWSQRVAAHRAMRPPTWQTVETLDLVPLLRATGGPLLVDCLGRWVTGLVDRAGLWEDLPAARELLDRERRALVAALADTQRLVVAVTNEVGWSLVPTTPSGRFFQDELGRLNADLGAMTRYIYLVVAGRVLPLGQAEAVPPRRPLPGPPGSPHGGWVGDRLPDPTTPQDRPGDHPGSR